MNFRYSLPRKKVSISYGNLRISRITNFKNRSFSPGQLFLYFKSNQTRYGVCHAYLECKTKIIFGIAFPEKKLVFQTEIWDYFQYLTFNYSVLHRVKELSKSNQKRYGVSNGYLECKKKSFWYSLP